MLFVMFLAASAAITPAQSARADEIARTYLMPACANGTERIGVVTVADGVLHDLSQNGTTYTVGFDEQAFRKLCPRGPLLSYHCHPTNDPLSLFPGLGEDGRSSDFGTVAFLEFMCAEEGTDTVIEHRLVHTGGDGAIVRFGLRGASLERARGLGRQVAEASAVEPTLNRYGVPDMRALLSGPKIITALHEALNELYASIHESYGKEVLNFLRKTCPAAKSEADLTACRAFTLAAFIAQTDPCGDRFIELPGSSPRPCLPATGERIQLLPRYPDWTELVPETYDAFTGAPHAVVAFCSDSGGGTPSCQTVLSEMERRLPNCGGLKRGYVDTDRYPRLRERHGADFSEVILLESGRRFTINVNRPSAHLLKLILCGAETLFEGFSP